MRHLALAGFVALSGCAANEMRVKLGAPHVEVAAVAGTTSSPLKLTVEPVQLGAFVGKARDARGWDIPTSVRVPQEVPTTRFVVAPAEEPKLNGNTVWPWFDVRTVPLLPYGAFWVQLENISAAPVTVDRSQLHLVADGHDVKQFSDSGALEGRYRRTLDEIKRQHWRTGRPLIGDWILRLHIDLPMFDRPVTILAGHSWWGYVVFDTHAFNQDEYADFLRRAGTLRFELRDGGGDSLLSAVDLTAQPAELDAVCLPYTSKPSFARCEVLVAPDPGTTYNVPVLGNHHHRELD